MISSVVGGCFFPGINRISSSRLMVISDTIFGLFNSVIATVYSFFFLLAVYLVICVKYAYHIILFRDICLNCSEGRCYNDFVMAVTPRNKRELLFMNLLPIVGPIIVAAILFLRIRQQEPLDNIWNSLTNAYSDTMELPLTLIPTIPTFICKIAF